MLNDDSFARLVAEDVKNRVTDSQTDYLRMPENWHRWKRALEVLLQNLGQQLEELTDKERIEIGRYEQLGVDGVRLMAEVQTDIAQRRRKISRFRFHVETRLDEVARLISASSGEDGERIQNFELLRSAIIKHREIIEVHDLDFTTVDEALWASLDGVWEFDEINYSDL
jgi:two-component sensor histidine kinase